MHQRVAFRQVYEALGIDVTGGDEVVRSFEFEEGVRADVRVTRRPTYGVTLHKAGDYIVLDRGGFLCATAFHETTEQAGISPFVTEIIVSRVLDVPDDLGTAYRERKEEAKKSLFDLLRRHEKHLRSVADTVAGVLGLRLFHHQAVLKMLCEEPMLLGDDGRVDRGTSSPGVRLLEPITLTAGTAGPIRMGPQKALAAASASFPWLLRAWRTGDLVTKFTSLFIPLEVCLTGVSGERDPRVVAAEAQLRTFIDGHGGDAKAEVLGSLKLLVGRIRPSLFSRFEELAKDAKQPGWENDVKAFDRFNEMRNAMLHRGSQDLQLKLEYPVPAPGSAEEEQLKKDVIDLEDLVERYMSVRFFGNAQVYPSRWRPRRQV